MADYGYLTKCALVRNVFCNVYVAEAFILTIIPFFERKFSCPCMYFIANCQRHNCHGGISSWEEEEYILKKKTNRKATFAWHFLWEKLESSPKDFITFTPLQPTIADYGQL
jgi:hypothetical protein